MLYGAQTRISYVSSFGLPGSTDHITITNNHVSSSGLPQQLKTAAGIYLQDANASVVSGNTTNNNTEQHGGGGLMMHIEVAGDPAR